MKMTIKNRTALVALLFGLALPLGSKVYASGHFATNYTNASLTGVYGYGGEGWTLGPANPNNNGTNVPIDNVGVMWFDGNGSLSFTILSIWAASSFNVAQLITPSSAPT